MSDDESTPGDEIPQAERDALLSVAHGAVVTSGGISVQRGLSVVTDAVLTRGLGPELYGVYAFGWRLTNMVLRFASLGATTTLMRDIPAFSDDPNRRRRILGLAYLTTAVTASLLAGTMFLSADWLNRVTLDHPAFLETFRLFAVLVVALGFVRLHGSALKAAKSANAEVLLGRIARPLTRLVAVAIAVLLGYSVVGVVGALVVAFTLVAVVAYPATIRTIEIRPSFEGLRAETADFYDHAVPSALASMGSIMRSRVDVVLIGIFLTSTAAGIYNVVLLLVGIAGIPLGAFNQLLPPVASDLYSDGKTEVLDDVYSTVTRLVVTLTVPILAIHLVFGRDLLAVFGPKYTRGYAVLLVFLVGRFTANAAGASGLLLSMTNNQYTVMLLDWGLAVSNVVLTYVFVLEFGLIGAALGTSTSMVVQNSLQVGFLLRYEGLWPFDRTFLRPIAAGIGMAGTMVAFGTVLDGPVVLAVGPLAGLLVFAGLLVAFGTGPRDRLIVGELATRYRQWSTRRL